MTATRAPRATRARLGKCVSGSSICKCTQDSDCKAQEDGVFCADAVLRQVEPQLGLQGQPGDGGESCDGSANTACSKAECDKLSGKCGFISEKDGKSCDADGTVCSSGDACAKGVCTAGQVLACDDNNPCTTDVCDAKEGCKSTATSAPCGDGNACTQGDACKGGVCVWPAAAVRRRQPVH